MRIVSDLFVKRLNVKAVATIVIIRSFYCISDFHRVKYFPTFTIALGKPYGKMAYGGTQDDVLPRKYRLMSALAIVIFLIASLLILVKVEIIKMFPFPDLVDLGLLLFALFLGLNTIANATSKSKSEKQIMTSLSLVACLCLIIIAFGL